MLVRRPRLLLGCHVLTEVGDRIAGAGEIGGGKGDAVRVGGEDAAGVHHIVAVQSGGGQLLERRALHALPDHRRDHFPVRHLLGPDVGQRRADAVVGHRVTLRQIADPGAELGVSNRRDFS